MRRINEGISAPPSEGAYNYPSFYFQGAGLGTTEMLTRRSRLHGRRIYILGGALLKYTAPSVAYVTAIPVYVKKRAFAAVSLEHK